MTRPTLKKVAPQPIIKETRGDRRGECRGRADALD
jgi:hypothetical protein